MIELFIEGRPIPKARARVTMGGHAYTPKRTKEYEGLVKREAAEVMDGSPPTDRPVTVTVCVVFGHKTKTEADPHTSRPDLDNVVKSVTDALNGVVYLDDSQIVGIAATKSYGTPEGVAVTVREVV